MAGNLGHLAPFWQTLEGPYQPNGLFDDMPGRERFVPIFFREGMEVPPGSVLRGSWLVPTVLAGPVVTWRSPGLLPILRQEGHPEQLRGDGGGGVAVQPVHSEQFSRVERAEPSGMFNVVNLKFLNFNFNRIKIVTFVFNFGSF